MVRVFIYYVSIFTALLSDATIVVSRSDEVEIEHLRRIREKTYYVPIGTEPLQLLSRDEASQALSKFGFRKSKYAIATIAELTANKGLRFALKAVALLKEQNINVSYLIIGEGEERVELVKRARDLNITDRIHFLGFIPDASKYLKAFDAFLLPSIKEGMPYVLLEAALAGLPIITTMAVSPEVVEGYENIIRVRPADPKAIVDAIAKVVTKRDYPGVPSAVVQNKFQLSEMLKKTLNLY